MKPHSKAAGLFFVWAALMCGQIHVNETADLAEDKSTDSILVTPPPDVPADAQVSVGRIKDKDGRILPAQAQAASPATSEGLKINFSDLFFWGEAYLPITFTPAKGTAQTATYRLWRGVKISPTLVDVPRNSPGQIWIFNPGNQAIEARWRVLSGTDGLCGLDQQGNLRKDCTDISRLPDVRIPPSGSVAIAVYVPTWWRDPLEVFGGVHERKAQLNLYFGRDVPSQPFTADLSLGVHSSLADAMNAWVPPLARNLLYVLFWVTIGATLLMVAQVMIPNFRQSLQIENRVEELKERLRAISSGVGSRLYTRCQQEIMRMTEGLGIRESDGKTTGANRFWKPFWPGSWWSRLKNVATRLALSGNTAELTRLQGILPRLESRLALTERFSDVLTAFLSADTLAAAPNSVFDREEDLRTLREILSRQLLTDAEEAGARAILCRLEDGGVSAADFTADLNSRLDALRRQLAVPVFQNRAIRYIDNINGCREVLAETPDAVPKGGWTVDELIYRDLMAVKLRVIVFAIEIECLLRKDQALDQWILGMLQSSDPIVIARIYGKLKQVSEGIPEDDIRAALKAELWDTWFEPPNVRTQDVIQFTFAFREKALNRSTARDTFQCYWKITPFGDPDDTTWEEGWSIQHIPRRRRFTVEPEIYDASGNMVDIRKDPEPGGASNKQADTGKDSEEDEDSEQRKRKGEVEIIVDHTTGLSKRAIRGVIDAVITALVPVVTVAVTQAQGGGSITVDKLVLLGFTSQAIRAAIIPESVRQEAPPKTTITENTPPTKPPSPLPTPITPPPVDPDPKSQSSTAAKTDTGAKDQTGSDSSTADAGSATAEK